MCGVFFDLIITPKNEEISGRFPPSEHYNINYSGVLVSEEYLSVGHNQHLLHIGVLYKGSLPREIQWNDFRYGFCGPEMFRKLPYFWCALHIYYLLSSDFRLFIDVILGCIDAQSARQDLLRLNHLLLDPKLLTEPIVSYTGRQNSNRTHTTVTVPVLNVLG